MTVLFKIIFHTIYHSLRYLIFFKCSCTSQRPVPRDTHGGVAPIRSACSLFDHTIKCFESEAPVLARWPISPARPRIVDRVFAAISPNHIRPRRVNTFGKTFRGAAGLGGRRSRAPFAFHRALGSVTPSGPTTYRPRGRPSRPVRGRRSWLGVPPKRETHPAAPYIGPVVGAPDETGNMPDNVVSWTWHHSERAASPACDGIGIPKLAVAHSDLVAFEVCPQTRSLHTVYRRDALCCHVYAPV